jgi:hypothetical protein
MHLVHRKTCRICKSPALTPVIDLGEQYLQGSFVKDGSSAPPMRRIDMKLVRCNPQLDEQACGLLQLAVTVPPQVLYESYWYRSGTNQTMRDHLKGIAASAMELAGNSAAVALDIGCNDGTLLKNYPKSFRRLGVDPSDVAQTAGADLEVVQDLFPSAKLKHRLGETRCDIITSVAMFYDLEDPVAFVEGLKALLAPDGVWIFEMSYMPAMLERNSYDTLCHEHLEYYSFAVIEQLLKRCGLKVFRVSFNDINGGSVRCYATHAGSQKFANETWQREMTKVRLAEFDLELDTDKPYLEFQRRIEAQRQELMTLLKGLKEAGKTIHVYGASTKGNTILQWCEIDKHVTPYAADRNPDKHGARTLGTDITILSEEQSRAMRPDYYLVLPWHFRDEFLAREAALLSSGTKFIFPLPAIEIVGA